MQKLLADERNLKEKLEEEIFALKSGDSPAKLEDQGQVQQVSCLCFYKIYYELSFSCTQVNRKKKEKSLCVEIHYIGIYLQNLKECSLAYQ